MGTCALVGAVDFNAEHLKAMDAAGAFDFVIAVDGGFASLEAIGREADMAIGDFDSLGYVPRCRRVSRHPVKKDKSDMELAMEKAVFWDNQELFVYGALAKRLDHTIANLQLFARYSERGIYVTGVGDDFAVRCVTGPDVFELPEGASAADVAPGTRALAEALAEALKVTERLDDKERRARQGLVSRAVTIR